MGTIAAQVIGLPAGVVNSLNGTTALGLTATGASQATALSAPAATNVFSTVAASTGVILNPGSPGDVIDFYNGGANSLSVYPPVGGVINNLAANTAVAIATLKSGKFVCRDSINFFSILSA